MKKTFQTEFTRRQYMLSEDFEVYYYNDSNIKPVKNHKHDYYEFYFFMEGDVEIIIEGSSYAVKAGDLILIPPQIPHYPRFKSWNVPYRRFVLWISRQYCNDLMRQSTDYGYVMQITSVKKQYVFHNDAVEFNTVTSLLFELVQEARGDRFGRETKIILELNSLILHLNRMIYERRNKKSPQIERALYLKLCDYIGENLEEELSLEKIAKEFFLSKYYISHVFKENIGISIHQYITKKRLAACRDAIIVENKISKVFQQYGFTDYSSFYRAFKKEYGISPKDYKDSYLLAENE